MVDYELVVVGACKVGKNSLIKEIGVKNTIAIKETRCSYEIIKTNNEEDMKKAKGFILVYAINSYDSYQAIQNIRKEILNLKSNKTVPMVLCGNKFDLNQERDVESQEAMIKANEWKIPFFETSTVTPINLENIVFYLMQEVYSSGLMDIIKQFSDDPMNRYYLKFMTNSEIIPKSDWDVSILKHVRLISGTNHLSMDHFIDFLFGEDFKLMCMAWNESYVMGIIAIMKQIFNKMNDLLPSMIYSHMKISHPSLISIFINNNMNEISDEDEKFSSSFQFSWVRSLIAQCLIAKGIDSTQSTYACSLYLTITVKMLIEHVYATEVKDTLSWLPKSSPEKAYEDLINLFQSLSDVCQSLKEINTATLIDSKLVVSFDHSSR